VLSGDNPTERSTLQQMMGKDAILLFNQQPADKLHYIEHLQESGERVMMIGDGLNDAGALKQSNVGIALTDDCNNFTPASDAIMDAKQLSALYRFIRLCRANKQIVIASFILSILYNIVGLSFAVQGVLSPMIAAILMPASSLSILLVTFGSSNIAARLLRC
jgi:Cu+-exporting ATPase